VVPDEVLRTAAGGCRYIEPAVARLMSSVCVRIQNGMI